MKNKKIPYLISSCIFFLLTIGYVIIVVVDFYYGYTPSYLTVLHIITMIVSLIAAIVNLKRYRK